jgi:hypothetical protein
MKLHILPVATALILALAAGSAGAQVQTSAVPTAGSAPALAPPPSAYSNVAPAAGLSAGTVGTAAQAVADSMLPEEEEEQKIEYTYKGPGPLNGVELPQRLFNNIPPRL